MTSNLNRDPMRAWRQPRRPSNADPKLHATLFSKCEVRARRQRRLSKVWGVASSCDVSCLGTSARAERNRSHPARSAILSAPSLLCASSTMRDHRRKRI